MDLESSNSLPRLAVSREDSDQTQALPSKFDVIKNYKPQGELKLYRLSSSTSFTCGHCSKEKKAVIPVSKSCNPSDYDDSVRARIDNHFVTKVEQTATSHSLGQAQTFENVSLLD